MGGFVVAVDPVNRLADHRAGFVWGLRSSEAHGTTVDWDESHAVVSLSVLESSEALHAFVYRNGHGGLCADGHASLAQKVLTGPISMALCWLMIRCGLAWGCRQLIGDGRAVAVTDGDASGCAAPAVMAPSGWSFTSAVAAYAAGASASSFDADPSEEDQLVSGGLHLVGAGWQMDRRAGRGEPPRCRARPWFPACRCW